MSNFITQQDDDDYLGWDDIHRSANCSIFFADDYRIIGLISVNDFNSVRVLIRLMRISDFINQGLEDTLRISRRR